MTVRELEQAFEERTPVWVTHWTIPRPVRCAYLYEIGRRRDSDGGIHYFAAGMDANGRSLIHGLPEHFSLEEPKRSEEETT